MKIPVFPRLHILRKHICKFDPNSMCNKSLIEMILYQFRIDMAAWNRLACPKHIQPTWWKIVSNPLMGFMVSRWEWPCEAMGFAACMSIYSWSLIIIILHNRTLYPHLVLNIWSVSFAQWIGHLGFVYLYWYLLIYNYLRVFQWNKNFVLLYTIDIVLTVYIGK